MKLANFINVIKGVQYRAKDNQVKEGYDAAMLLIVELEVDILPTLKDGDSY